MATEWHPTENVYEAFDSLDEDMTEDGITCSIDLHVKANKRHIVARDLMTGRKKWPYLPEDIAPVITRCKIKHIPSSIGSDGQGINYDTSVLSCTFTTDIKDALSEELVPSQRFVRQDHRGYFWRLANTDLTKNEPDDPITEEEAPGKQEFGMVLVRTHYDIAVGSLPSNWKQYIGKTHSKQFRSTLLQDDFAPGTLRFDAPKVSRTVRTDSKVQLNLTTRWSYKENGHNKFYRPATDSYEPILKLDPTLADDAEDAYVVHENFPQQDLTAVFFQS